MKITLKLYASLSAFLPSEAKDHQLLMELPEAVTPLELLQQQGVPAAKVHLVLVNGVFVSPQNRNIPLKEGDHLAVWPAVAGG